MESELTLEQEIEAYLREKRIGMEATHIPDIMSPRRGENMVSWNIVLGILVRPEAGHNEFKEKPKLVTKYYQGLGHVPYYLDKPMYGRMSLDESRYYDKLKTLALDKGWCFQRPFKGTATGVLRYPVRALPKPKLVDVMYCLVMDANVFDYDNFADWADTFGYNSDSIKDKALYDGCIENAFALRNFLGFAALEDLSNLYSEY